MAKIIERILSSFDADGRATLNIPNGAESVALRFYETAEIDPDPARNDATVAVILLIDTDAPNHGAHTRNFRLVPDDTPLPPGFKKYVATFPRGPEKRIMHVVEI